MNPKILLCFALVLSGVLSGCSTTGESSRRYITRFPNSGELPQVSYYGKPSPETLRHIKVERIALAKADVDRLAELPKESTNSSSRLVEEDPDTMHDGSWKTTLYIVDDVDTNHCVRVELTDHKSGGVKHEWLNDKILFVEVWWGRIAYTDFILNIETLRFLYIEDGFTTFESEDMLDSSQIQK
jgi:hypothetical protein